MIAIAPFASPGPYSQFGPKFGSYDDYLADLPLHYMPAMRFGAPASAFFAAGTRDGPIREDAERLAGALKARGQRAVLDVVSGQTHTWAGVQAVLPAALEFASHSFG
jgi:hypothetical protein